MFTFDRYYNKLKNFSSKFLIDDLSNILLQYLYLRNINLSMSEFITKVQNNKDMNQNLINYKNTNYTERLNPNNTIIKNFYYLDSVYVFSTTNNCIYIFIIIEILKYLNISKKNIFGICKVIPEQNQLNPKFYTQKFRKMLS